ncbi:MAG: M20/M25/M40 family metallo-hydrolase [Candidatus Cloacimonetes bacterium]|nr:M20/M25/M40 family metallo-hydrolase [Candidatus Cloacimonadota bacterium]
MEQTLLDYFLALVQIDSESKQEGAIARRLTEDLKALGAQVRFDSAHEQFGGEVGNLYASFDGIAGCEPILFAAHLDTVRPGRGVKPQVKDGFVVTDGATILGADDKSGIAQAVWAVKELKEAGEPHAPIELMFTVSEETGLLGAVHADYSLIRSKLAYALDSHVVGQFMTQAPTQYNIDYTVKGRASHAGVEPEKGINAIQIAAVGIAAMKLGRIDESTTCNIGNVEGGIATNVVPPVISVKGEVRGHDIERIQSAINAMNTAMEQAVAAMPGAVLEKRVYSKYASFTVADDEPVVLLAMRASKAAGCEPKTFRGGGGSDANIFNQKGIRTIVAGTGMDNVHTVEERISVAQLEKGCRWVKEVIRMHTNG